VGKLPTSIAWQVDDAFQLLCRHLGAVEVARRELEYEIHGGKVRLLRWDTSVPGWEHDAPQPLSADAARLTRLRLDEGYAIILTRDPIGRPAECILNGETWYHNGNLHYVIPHDDLVARWSIFAKALDQRVAAVSAPMTAGLTGKPEGVSPRVWAVAGLLDTLDQARGSSDAGIGVSHLLAAVRAIAPEGITVSETTLREARRFRKDRAAYCRQCIARKRKARRRRA
jgi:hypothetical protein